MDEIITFDFVYECWKTKVYPENFDELLEKYLISKNNIFVNLEVDIKKQSVPIWLSKVLVSIQIGILRDEQRFIFYKKYWENLLDTTWIVSLEDRWVMWA